jgi:hypothetical protein
MSRFESLAVVSAHDDRVGKIDAETKLEVKWQAPRGGACGGSWYDLNEFWSGAQGLRFRKRQGEPIEREVEHEGALPQDDEQSDW